MNHVRIFLVNGWLAYRGGFRVLTPSVFIPLVIAQPVAQLWFFLQLGHYTGARDSSFYVLGNALYGCAVGGLYTLAVAVAVERRNNTLVMVLASPVNRVLLFSSRMIPAFCIGMVTGVVTLVAGELLGAMSVRPGQIPLLALLLAVACLSACSFGLLIGTIGLRARDVNFSAGLVLSLCLLLSGADVPVSDFPAPVRLVADLMPMTLSITAARRGLAGQSGVGVLLAGEVALALGYVLLTALMLRRLERGAKARGTLELS
jgi:ABC-2 type transport system permease protein